MTEQEIPEVKWETCAESGKKFKYPDGAKCSVCKRMVLTKYYVYVDMDPVCLKCRREQINRIIESIKASGS